MAQTHYPSGQLFGLQSTLAVLADDQNALNRARQRFNDSPPSYRSQESTAFPSPSVPGEEDHERVKWALIQRHGVSLPYEQFRLQVRTEYERMKRHSDWRGKPLPEGKDLYTFAEEAIVCDWKKQGIFKASWDDERVGRWKHEEPLDLDSTSDSDTEDSLHPENIGARMALRAAEIEAASRSEPPPPRHVTIRKHNHEMSRPYHQFLWQVSMECQFLTFALRRSEPLASSQLRGPAPDQGEPADDPWEDDLAILPPDLNTIAYESVMKRWQKQGLYMEEWGAMPGFTWLHELPLAEILRDELGNDVCVPTSIFQGGPLSPEEISIHRRQIRQEAQAREEELSRPRLFGVTGNNTQQTLARQFAHGFHEPSLAEQLANGRHEPSLVAQFANGRHEPSLAEQFANFPEQPATPPPLEPAATVGGGLFGLPNNPTSTTRPRFSIFSLSNAERPSSLFGPQDINPENTETSTNRPLFGNPRIGLFADHNTRPMDQPSQGNPSPPPEEDDSASTHAGSSTSTSTYETVPSISSHTSAGNRKRQADTPEPEGVQSPPRTRSRHTKDQIQVQEQEQEQEQTQTQTQSASKKRPSCPSEPQPKPKRWQQAPRAAGGNKKTATSRNGQVSPPSSNEAPTLRRSPRLQKMKQKDKSKSKGKGKGKAKGK